MLEIEDLRFQNICTTSKYQIILGILNDLGNQRKRLEQGGFTCQTCRAVQIYICYAPVSVRHEVVVGDLVKFDYKSKTRKPGLTTVLN